MKRTEFDKLVNEYGQLKARKALKWFCENHSESFRQSVKAAQFCVDNEVLWQ